MYVCVLVGDGELVAQLVQLEEQLQHKDEQVYDWITHII